MAQPRFIDESPERATESLKQQTEEEKKKVDLNTKSSWPVETNPSKNRRKNTFQCRLENESQFPRGRFSIHLFLKN